MRRKIGEFEEKKLEKKIIAKFVKKIPKKN